MNLLSHRFCFPLMAILLSGGISVTTHVDVGDFKVAVKPGAKAFTPQVLKIKLGDKVIWVNQSNEEHFLTSAGPTSRHEVSGTESLEIHKLLQPGESYSHNFTQVDTYYYFCAIHMQMWGTVIVEK